MASNKLLYSARVVFNFIVGLSSIVSVFLVLFKSDEGVIALYFFCIFLLAALVSLILSLCIMVRRENPENEWQINFVFINYLAIDESHHEHDLYKIIQCKRPYLTSIWHKYKWSGDKYPRISSQLQTVGEIVKGVDGEFDKVKMILKHPLVYNQMTTLHFHADLDDSDNSAQPYLGFKVTSPMSMILFKVTLKNKDDNYSELAVLEREPLENSFLSKKSVVTSVVFDKATKTYTYALQEPEPGYFYKLCWKK